MNKIFIQIASYRDPLLISTIQSAIHKAKYPDRVSFGICLQDANKEIFGKVKKIPRVRAKFFDYHESQGIGWARSTAQGLCDNEEYALQIDSHMQFVPNWDVDVINSIRLCPSSKPLFSEFCPDWYKYWVPIKLSSGKMDWKAETKQKTLEEKDKESPVTIAANYFDSKAHPYYLHITPSWNKATSNPLQHAFICAHFIFGSNDFFRQVPIDPKMGYFYEENAITLRAWTNNWDIYVPHKIVIRHTWNRNYSWDDASYKVFENDRKISSKRFARLLGIGDPLKQFKLGNDRTLEQYFNFSGVNYLAETIKPFAKKGKVNLK